MSLCGERGLTWTYKLLKQLLLYSALILVILLAVTYYSLSRDVNLQPKAIEKFEDLTADVNDNTTIPTASAITSSKYLNNSETGNKTLDVEFMQRRSLVEDICLSANTISGSPHGVFTHQQSGVIYCFVPKSGCTFWKRVFNFVNNMILNSTYKSPFEIPRIAVHSLSTANGDRYDNVKHQPRHYPIRFIVTRDPMSRMIASYLDKMYLPDFWENVGRQFMQLARGLRISQEYMKRQFESSNIFSNQNRFLQKSLSSSSSTLQRQKGKTNKISEDDFMRKHFDELAATFNSSLDPISSTSTQIKCGKYVTFSEFIVGSMYYPEPHWTPAYQLCNPCQFLPTHIGRMETFTADARVILSKMGLDDVLENFDSVAQINEELRSITDYHFTRAFKSSRTYFYSSCLTTKELAQRLWNNFQWQGYIHPLLEYRIPAFSEVDEVQADLMTQIWKAREISLKYPEAMKKMKKDFARKLISTLSDSVLEELTCKFHLDYNMFGYQKVNRDIFDKSQ